MTTRLNININNETSIALEELAARRQTTVTEIVRRAVSVYRYVEDEVIDAPGTRLLLCAPDGDTELLRGS